ncbi:MAG: hypothetical protein HZC50_04285 [Nitrospirae bacterium]|nr:hypothetical protein [Nitrospirota bacterium]
MKILAVETATTWQSVAILEDDRIVAMHEQEAGGAQGSLSIDCSLNLDCGLAI